MCELHQQLFPHATGCPARYLKEWLQQQAITPFWLAGPALSSEETEWVLARANSKNALLNYSRDEMREMIVQAWPGN